MRNFLNFQRTTPLLTKITTLALPSTGNLFIGNRRSGQRANHIYYAKNRVRPEALSDHYNEFYQC